MSFIGIGNADSLAGITLSSLQALDIARINTIAPSISTGAILNGPGFLFGYKGTTGGGTINFSLNGSPIGATTVSANVTVMFPAPIQFLSLSASASVGVCTVFYRAL